MNRLSFFTDPVNVGRSLAYLVAHTLKREVNSFCESEYPENHIFVDAVLAGELGSFPTDTNQFRIFDLTRKLLDTPNEDMGDELAELLSEYTEDELVEELMES